jgi:integrase
MCREAGVEPHQLTRRDVLDYLAARDLATNTRIKYLQHVSAWAKFAGIPDPTTGIRRPAAHRGKPKPISDDHLAALLSRATGRTRMFILFGAYAGFRSFETAKVRMEDLEAKDAAGQYRLRVTGKGGRVDVIPCNPALAASILDYAQRHGISSGRLFPTATSNAVRSALMNLGKSIGQPFSSHQLRHWYGTSVHSASGGDLLLTQQLMRHSSPSTTAVYAAVAPDNLRAVVDRLPRGPGAPENTKLPSTGPLANPRARLRVLTGG